MAQRPVRVRVLERGVAGERAQRAATEGIEAEVVLQQRVGESGRNFAHRVGAKLAALAHANIPIFDARVSMSPAQGQSALQRRLGLLRAILCQLPDSGSSAVWVEASKDASPAGHLDLHALCETLGMQMSGSRTVVRAA